MAIPSPGEGFWWLRQPLRTPSEAVIIRADARIAMRAWAPTETVALPQHGRGLMPPDSIQT